MSEKIRVLVVDDSAFARQVVRRVLARAGDIEVVDFARDGAEALEKIEQLQPDVLTLDLVMPNVDGLGVLEALPREGAPRVVVLSSSAADTDLGAAALAAGAVDLVRKPTTQATDRLYEMAEELIERVRVAAQARPLGPMPPTPRLEPERAHERRQPQFDAVLIGASTGGPQALGRILPQFPSDFPVPIVVVLHLPSGYVASIAARLDQHCALSVMEGNDGLVLAPGMAVLAPSGAHLRLVRDAVGLRVRLDYLARVGELHCPSVDALFESSAQAIGARVLAVVLTGMGDDGLAGARALVHAGATVIAQDEATSVVYGMPRAIAEAGLASEVVPLHRMVDFIVRRAMG